MAFGGTPPVTGATEEWTGAGAPIGAWSTGGSLNTARGFGSSAGIYTAGLYYGGTPTANNSTFSNNTESYNGSSWTELADLNQAKFAAGGVGATNTAALNNASTAVTINVGGPANLNISGNATASSGSCLTFSVISEDTFGNPSAVTGNKTVSFLGSDAGDFFSDSSCTGGNEISTIDILDTNSSATFSTLIESGGGR